MKYFVKINRKVVIIFINIIWPYFNPVGLDHEVDLLHYSLKLNIIHIVYLHCASIIQSLKVEHLVIS